MNPLFSIVIPTYNHAHFLGRALKSVLDQTCSNWEVLLVDNHSEDNTDEVIKNLNDSRIHLFKIHNNGVIAASRNLGIRESRGEWIAFLDSDDCWYSEKLEKILAVIRAEGNCDVLCHDELIVDINTGEKRVLRSGPYQDAFYETLLVEGNRLSPSAAIVRQSFVARHGVAFNESRNYITVEDYDFWLQLASVSARFRFVHEVLGEYVIHGSNSSVRLAQHLKNCETLLHDHVFKLQRFHPNPDKLWKQVLPRVRLAQAKQAVISSKFGEALRLVVRTLVTSPRRTTVYIFSKLNNFFNNKIRT